MNYSNHNLRTDIQEWKNRLYRATYNQFGHQLKFLFNNIDSNKQLYALITEANNKFNYSGEQLNNFTEQFQRGAEFSFESETEQAAFCYQYLKYLFNERDSFNVHQFTIFAARDFERTKTKFIEEYISPILNFFHDRLDKSNSVVYLLEKYKMRTEWFTKSRLYSAYKNAKKSYEQIFEDDLRLFLFEQGIDYPFSTPMSASGRADIIGEIETDDPLIVEIKVFDRDKGYGPDRIKEGFTQIVKYANDYNKDFGFLVVFNMDEVELNFIDNDNGNLFPPSTTFNNKTFFVIIVNCLDGKSASRAGIIKQVEISMKNLTKE